MRIIGAIVMLLCVSASAFADQKITRKNGAGGGVVVSPTASGTMTYLRARSFI